MISFNRDRRKAHANAVSHGVGFDEAASVFYDEHAVQFFDEVNSSYEDRYVMLGLSQKLRILVVVHCERDDGRTIRIISARKATKTEQTYYRGQGR
jgi:uncharacterized DUF497 family protein